MQGWDGRSRDREDQSIIQEKYVSRVDASSEDRTRNKLEDWAPRFGWLWGPTHIVLIARGVVGNTVIVASIEDVTIAREMERPGIGVDSETKLLALVHDSD
jgi:hypothetical protein